MTEVIVRQLAGLIGGDIHSYLFLSLSVVLFGAALFGLLWLDWKANRWRWRWRRHTPRHRREVQPRRLVAWFNAVVVYETVLWRLAKWGRS